MPFPPPGDLPNPRIEPVSPEAPAMAGEFFTTEPPGKPYVCYLTGFSRMVCSVKLNDIFTVSLSSTPLQRLSKYKVHG